MPITKLPAEIELGAAEVLWGDVTVGHTEEGAVVTVTKDLVTRIVDQFGQSVVEQVVVGEHIELVVKVAQFVLDTLLIAFPELTSGTGDYAMAGSVPGQKLGDSAQELIARPYAADGTTEDLVIYKAIAREAGPVEYNNEGDRVIPVTFEGLIDPTRQDGDRLYRFNAPAAGA